MQILTSLATQPVDHRHHDRRRLEVLYELIGRIAALGDTEKILDVIVNAATTLLSVEGAGLRLCDGDDLVLKACTESAAAIMARPRLKSGESLSGTVVTAGGPIVVEDLFEETRFDPRHKRAAMELGFHGFLGVPLRAHERIIGVLNVYSKERRRFGDDEIALLTSFANHASLAIEKDRMLRDARDQATRLRALARLNQAVSSSLDIDEVLHVIAGAAAELMRAATVSLWVADETRREVELRAMSDDRQAADFPARTRRFNEDIAGWVAAHGRPLEILDVSRDPRVAGVEWFRTHELTSAYAIPITFHNSLLGVLLLFGAVPFQFEDADRELLDAFVTQAGVAIRNARLYEKTRNAEADLAQRSRELDLLTRMGEFLQACTTEAEAYAVVGQFVGEFFPEDTGTIFVTSASRNMVEARATWGGVPTPDANVFKPEDCWALRRGRPHLVDTRARGLLCSHVPDPPPAVSLCIPLVAQGESLGALYLGGAASPKGWAESHQRLAATIADHVGLAVANLKLRDTLRRQSVRDPLTGLFNRRYLEETLERELRRAEHSASAVGVIMLDVDNFKAFNDTSGHDVGDLVLRELGGVLNAMLRGGDVVCRYGGEEFVVILPDASIETTHKRAERLREAVKQLVVSHRGQIVGSVTISAGVAAFPEHGTTGEGLLRAADAALYRAKSAGRDRVIVPS